MASAPARFVLITSAYSPLLLVLAARFWSASRVVAVVLVLGAVASVVVLAVYVRQLHRMQAHEIVIVASDPAVSELLGHISAYLFPFLEVDFSNAASLVSLGLVYAVLIFIQVKTNLIHINPALYALGITSFRCVTSQAARTRSSHAAITSRPRAVSRWSVLVTASCWRVRDRFVISR